jgi:hypothetical protein
MPAAQYIPDADFAPAPAGTRVRLTTLLTVVVIIMATAVLIVMLPRDRHPPPLLVRIAIVGVAPVSMTLSWIAARIRRYRLVGEELWIELPFRTARFPLAGLVSALPDRDALRGAWKMNGNNGLGAIIGRFRSKRLGASRVFLTDPEHAVVLRWPDRCVVISPHQHTCFVETVRKRAGLAR